MIHGYIPLDQGAAPSAGDREFDAPPLVWSAEEARSQAGDDAGYAPVGRPPLIAGSPIKWPRARAERPA